MIKLREMRKKAKITQKEFAARIGAGQGTVSMWETNQSVPRVGMLPKIAQALGCSIQDLFPDPSQFKQV